MTIATATPQDVFAARREKPLPLVDVRMPTEYREIHADGATLAPLDALDPQALAQTLPRPIYLICRSGQRATKAAEQFVAAGIPEVVVVEGGTAAWEKAGLPVVRGKKCVSLERQVRIVAGTLVLTGVGLGWWVHPYLFGLSAFIGAGLVFAGVTDWCGMGMLLSKMPWNRSSC
jgi:rhodanese-related sulfurtransferase